MRRVLLSVFFVLCQFGYAQSQIAFADNFYNEANQKRFKKWFDYYNLNIQMFKPANHSSECISYLWDENSIYYKEFQPQDDLDSLINVNYSLSKRKYVSLGMEIDFRNGETYFFGWDDCQEIYLIDRDFKFNNLILWLGSSALAEDVFWSKNENIIYIVGFENYDGYTFFIYEFNLTKDSITKYDTEPILRNLNLNYFVNVYLSEREITSD